MISQNSSDRTRRVQLCRPLNSATSGNTYSDVREHFIYIIKPSIYRIVAQKVRELRGKQRGLLKYIDQDTAGVFEKFKRSK